MSDSAGGAERIERSIRAATGCGRPALSVFLTAGYPSRERFPGLLAAIAREVDLVEIGVPYSDPTCDGPTIQRASSAALAIGVDLPWILDTVSRSRVATPILLMSYVNPLVASGLEDLAARARAAGIAGFVVPDLPYEESAPLREVLDALDLALVQLVTPLTPPERLERLCRASRGFVYAVTVAGTTGGSAGRAERLLAYLDRVRGASSLPVLAGYGIRSAEQVETIYPHADGAIVGSALIESIERGEDPIEFLRRLRGG